MKRVIIESPYAGDVDKNVEYAHKCMEDSLSRGEAPLASHLIYTNYLDDTDKQQRRQGIKAGFSWGEECELVAVYCDYGISKGMELGIINYELTGKEIEYRKILDGEVRSE